MADGYDILIAGGGMVGASLACALAGKGLRIGVIEAADPDDRRQPSFDDRAIALAKGSQRILEGIGLWPALTAHAEPIHRVHVSDRGHFGSMRLDRRDEGVDALGYVITAREMGLPLTRQMINASDIELLAPARLTRFRTDDDRVTASVSVNGETRELSARLLVGADGGRSLIREQLGIEVEVTDYGHSAVIANLSTSQSHDGVAYERFTGFGPLAVLPMTGQRVALVWTLPPEQAEQACRWSESRFLSELQQAFGYRLGRLLRAGRRASYPLTLMQVAEHVRPRVALIGNAAHTVHPIGGQGYNLGIRDVAVLAEVIAEAAGQQQDIGDLAVLKRYADWRRADQQRVAGITDGLARLFSNPFAPVVLGRNLGLLAADLCPTARHLIARQFMGLNLRQPRLGRGIGLD